MSARQAILAGFPSPVFMNENGNRQAINAGGVFLDETGGAGPSPPTPGPNVFHSPINSVGAMMNHSS